MITEDNNVCYKCGRWGTEVHHIFFGNANRRLSEKYGLTVPLCIEHHRTGNDAVHNNREFDLELKRIGQKYFEENYPELDFIQIFGKNYNW